MTLGSGMLAELVERYLPDVDPAQVFALSANPSDLFNHGPGPKLQAAFGTGVAETAVRTLSEDEQAAASDVLQLLKAQKALIDSEADDVALKQLETSSWEILNELAERTDAIGDAVLQWKMFAENRLMGQYDITTITGREIPNAMLTDLLALIHHSPSEECESNRQAAAAVMRERLPSHVREEFDELLDDAYKIDRLGDERSLYGILVGAGHCRRALLEVGRRVLSPVGRIS